MTPALAEANTANSLYGKRELNRCQLQGLAGCRRGHRRDYDRKCPRWRHERRRSKCWASADGVNRASTTSGEKRREKENRGDGATPRKVPFCERACKHPAMT